MASMATVPMEVTVPVESGVVEIASSLPPTINHEERGVVEIASSLATPNHEETPTCDWREGERRRKAVLSKRIPKKNPLIASKLIRRRAQKNREGRSLAASGMNMLLHALGGKKGVHEDIKRMVNFDRNKRQILHNLDKSEKAQKETLKKKAKRRVSKENTEEKGQLEQQNRIEAEEWHKKKREKAEAEGRHFREPTPVPEEMEVEIVSRIGRSPTRRQIRDRSRSQIHRATREPEYSMSPVRRDASPNAYRLPWRPWRKDGEKSNRDKSPNLRSVSDQKGKDSERHREVKAKSDERGTNKRVSPRPDTSKPTMRNPPGAVLSEKEKTKSLGQQMEALSIAVEKPIGTVDNPAFNEPIRIQSPTDRFLHAKREGYYSWAKAKPTVWIYADYSMFTACTEHEKGHSVCNRSFTLQGHTKMQLRLPEARQRVDHATTLLGGYLMNWYLRKQHSLPVEEWKEVDSIIVRAAALSGPPLLDLAEKWFLRFGENSKAPELKHARAVISDYMRSCNQFAEIVLTNRFEPVLLEEICIYRTDAKQPPAEGFEKFLCGLNLLLCEAATLARKQAHYCDAYVCETPNLIVGNQLAATLHGKRIEDTKWLQFGPPFNFFPGVTTKRVIFAFEPSGNMNQIIDLLREYLRRMPHLETHIVTRESDTSSWPSLKKALYNVAVKEDSGFFSITGQLPKTEERLLRNLIDGLPEGRLPSSSKSVATEGGKNKALESGKNPNRETRPDSRQSRASTSSYLSLIGMLQLAVFIALLCLPALSGAPLMRNSAEENGDIPYFMGPFHPMIDKFEMEKRGKSRSQIHGIKSMFKSASSRKNQNTWLMSTTALPPTSSQNTWPTAVSSRQTSSTQNQWWKTTAARRHTWSTPTPRQSSNWETTTPSSRQTWTTPSNRQTWTTPSNRQTWPTLASRQTWPTRSSSTPSTTTRPNTMPFVETSTSQTRQVNSDAKLSVPTVPVESTTSSLEPTEKPIGKQPDWVDILSREPRKGNRKNFKTNKGAKPVFWCAHKGSALYTLQSPEANPFCQAAPSTLSSWEKLDLKLYGKVKLPLPVKDAWHCAIKKIKEAYYSNIVGDEFTNPLPTELLPMSKATCHDMIKEKKCPFAKEKMMEITDSLYRSNNTLALEFPGAIASIFVGVKTAEVTNCLAQRVDVFYRPHTMHLISPVLELKECLYGMGECRLSDNSTIYWEPECPMHQCKACDFKSTTVLAGEFTHSNGKIVFLSQTREQALTFEINAEKTTACDGMEIRLSDQGFGIPESSYIQMLRMSTRIKRYVTEEQLAAQLTAAQEATNRAIQALFHRECRRGSHRENPTLIARKMLNLDALVARWVSARAMEIFPCVEVPLEKIEYRASMDKCYKFIPVTVHLNDTQIEAFLDSEQRVLVSNSTRADCTHFRYQFFSLDEAQSKWIKIDTLTAQYETVLADHIFQLNEAKELENMNLEFVHFHAWKINTDEELVVFPHLNEFLEFKNWEQKIEEDVKARGLTLGALPGGIVGFAEGAIMAWIDSKIQMLIRWWIRLSCAFATFLFLRDIGIPLLFVYLIGPILNTVRGILGRPKKEYNLRKNPDQNQSRRRNTYADEPINKKRNKSSHESEKQSFSMREMPSSPRAIERAPLASNEGDDSLTESEEKGPNRIHFDWRKRSVRFFKEHRPRLSSFSRRHSEEGTSASTVQPVEAEGTIGDAPWNPRSVKPDV